MDYKLKFKDYKIKYYNMKRHLKLKIRLFKILLNKIEILMLADSNKQY